MAISALLDAVAGIDSEARGKRVHRKAMVTLLLFTGLRIGELCDVRWRAVDLAASWLNVEDSKTDA